MNKNILIFIAAFFAGALVALAVRTVRHDPYAAPAQPEQPAAATVHAPVAPAEDKPDHAAHNGAAAPVNTVCPICGMDVDPDVATATYDGKTIGFGCKRCPPQFAEEPDVYGPAALENKVVE